MLTFDVDKAKSLFTRQCIGETIVSLLQNSELNSLKIFDIVKKAGVSRVTFYRYYASTKDALEDYLHIIVNEFIIESDTTIHGSYLSYQHILFAFNFFDKYREYFLVMKKRGLYSILINAVNKFCEEHIKFDNEIEVYKTYSYAGSLLNTFLMWEENNKKDKAEDVARTMYELYGQENITIQ